MKECPDCPLWAANIDHVVSAQRFMFARNPTLANQYQGAVFIYCPWCGTALREARTAVAPGANLL